MSIVKLEENSRKRSRDDHFSAQSEVGSSYSDDDDEISSSPELKKILALAAAEPLMRCSWSGDFHLQLRYGESIYERRIYRFNAFVSSKACKKVHDACAAFGAVVNLEMLPVDSIWPKSFDRSDSGGPTDHDIALYLFPPLPLHQQRYDDLVNEMIDDDLAMRAILPNLGELLVFASTQLPVQSYILQGDFYLWGVFKNPSTSHHKD